MASTPVVKATSCAACRLASLRLFTGNFAPVRRPQIFLRHAQPVSAYSALRPSLSLRSGPTIEERVERESAPQNEDESAPSAEASDGTDAPWYLQVEPPKHSTLLYEPPPLPAVPKDAPRVVEPLLKFVSEDLGMDDLELLDLRDLDPPAALGPDLIMLFGTSRSERHLHVSAGRLVQWLRSRGIHADADGLLGRNELKTRLRRKARKEKLLGTSGVMRGGDDGISTGWVCVNMGTIGRSSTEHTIVGPDGRAAGFGALNLGSTVVVQLLTESRREELGLERLWNGILKRSRTEQKALGEGTQPLAAGSVAVPASAAHPRPSDRRPYSTSTRPSKDPLASFEDMVMGSANGRADSGAVNHILTNDAISKEPLMKRLQQFVELQPRHKAVRSLQARGEGTRNPFHQLFNVVAQSLPPEQRWAYQIWLLDTGRKFGVTVLRLQELRELIESMQAEPINVTRRSYLSLIDAALAPQENESVTILDQASVALQVVDAMYARGEQILANDVIVGVIEALLRSGASGTEADRMLAAFEALLSQAELPCPSEDLLLKLLDAYANAGNWDGFWKAWRIPPKFYRPRSARMYGYLYDRFANDGHQIRAINAIRWCVNEMVNEEPPVVPQGAVLDALKACIRVADPRAERIAQELVPQDRQGRFLANQEFVKLFRDLGVRPD